MVTPAHQRREIVRLAVPAFFALVAEPVFMLIDSAIVGHLGTTELAGLGIASNVLLTAAGVFVFLAYGTTAAVSRRLGAGKQGEALTAGIDGIWLGVVLGVTVAALVWVSTPFLVAAFGPLAPVGAQAGIYLRTAALSLPGMVVVMAATGLLRGLQDTRTPMVVAIGGFSANAGLSYLLVYPAGLGIAGAAWGTVIAQTAMAAALVTVAVVKARRLRACVRFAPGGVLRSARGGVPLLVRTVALRSILIVTTWVATSQGEVNLAAHQLAMVVWSTLAFVLDAFAIAAQALIGKALGAGDTQGARSLTGTMVRWGAVFGAVVGMVLAVGHGLIPGLFTGDEAVQLALAAALLVVALGQPAAGVAFVLDGVLIGAGDATWLAWAQVGFLVTYIPLALVVVRFGPPGPAGLVWLWVAFTAFMVIRSGTLWWRSRSNAWLVTGAN